MEAKYTEMEMACARISICLARQLKPREKRKLEGATNGDKSAQEIQTKATSLHLPRIILSPSVGSSLKEFIDIGVLGDRITEVLTT